MQSATGDIVGNNSRPEDATESNTNTQEAKSLLVESNQVQESEKVGISKKKVIIIILIVSVILAAIIILVVFLTLKDDDEQYQRQSNQFYEEKFLEIPSNESCYQYSQKFASKPHVAGMSQTLEIGELFAHIMEDLGYEAISDDIPNVVLDHYNSSQLFINGKEIDLSQEAIIGEPETNTSFRKRSWIAFSASGDHIAPLLYVNGGSSDDYNYLINNLSIDLDNNGVGYIGLAKRGYITAQAFIAGYYGLKGLILFGNRYNNDEQSIYPNGPELPNFGFRTDGRARGSVGCPGNSDANRLEDECDFNISKWDDLFPAIKYNLSMLAISPNTAIEIFEIMNNNVSNSSQCDIIINNTKWQSNLPINSCIGGTDDIMVHMVTSNDMHSDDNIRNVYGYLKGDKYPDEIVMIGAHRDAWGMGACDDISGTVTILEIARSFSVLRREYGWKPKRSIMFASWDAEEWGIYGSVDFNENNAWIDKIVAYFNFDMTVVGGSLHLYGNPILRDLALESAKQIQYPYPNDIDENNDGNYTDFTLFDTWWDFQEEATNDLQILGCYSDHCAFEFYSGIATLGAGFYHAQPPEKLPSIYHTFYDLNGWLDIVDPKWQFAKSIAMYAGLMMLKVSQQHLIPFDITRLELRMNEWIENDLTNHVNDANCSIIYDNYINLLIDASRYFQNATNIFYVYYQKTLDIINSDKMNNDDNIDQDIKKMNEILINIMKTLTLKYPEGIPSNKWYKQLIWSVGGKRFPYIWDVIDDGCNEDDLENAFQITTNSIINTADLLLSFKNI